MLDVSQIKLSKKDLEKGLKLPENLTPDLAYLGGFIAGDGNLFIENNKRYDITCIGNFRDEKDFFDNIIAPLFNKIFCLKVKPKFEGKNTYGIRIFSKGLLFFFNKILEVPVGKKSDKIFIPKIILSSDKLTKAFIQGLADADFSLCLKRRYKKVAYYPTIAGFLNSKRMMKQISVYLRRKCIPHSLLLNVKSFDKRFNKFWTSHRIYIYGKKNVYKWMLTIGFRNPKFLKIAREALLETS